MKKILLSVISALLISSCQAQDYPQEKLQTKSGKSIAITMINHGSIAIEYNGVNIQVDPVENNYGKFIDYSKFAKADIILVTHEHGDHLDKNAISHLSKEGTEVLLNPKSQQQVSIGKAITNGKDMQIKGIKIQAVPAYNTTSGREKFHPKGNGNGYVLQFEDIRIYISGDTEDIPEMKDIKNIDIALLSVNQPYTMTCEQCVKAAKVLMPKTLIPYHTGDTNTSKIVEDLKYVSVKVKIFNILK